MSGECLGGALWWKDLLQLAEEVGFSPARLVTAKLVTVGNKELQEVLGISPPFVFYCTCFKQKTVPHLWPILCKAATCAGFLSVSLDLMATLQHTGHGNRYARTFVFWIINVTCKMLGITSIQLFQVAFILTLLPINIRDDKLIN